MKWNGTSSEKKRILDDEFFEPQKGIENITTIGCNALFCQNSKNTNFIVTYSKRVNLEKQNQTIHWNEFNFNN